MAKQIQDSNLLYNILSPLVQFACRCHYHHFVVRGQENLPTNGAYIIAPCHQQALMEPLAVLNFAPKAPVFLARADIFRKPTIRAILTFLRIMPVYRIRDGQEQLGRNKEIFDHCRDVLLDGYPLCLMAEGRHNNRHHLLNFGKGMFRIAGETQLALGDYPLYIVPTGIDFDDYERPYSNLVVNIGHPIPVQPFMETYRTNEPLALNQMRDTLHAALIPLMHDVRDLDHYDEIMTLCQLLTRPMLKHYGLRNTAWNRFLMRQKITEASSHWFSTNSELHSPLSTLPSPIGEGAGVRLFSTLLSLIIILLLLAAVVTVPPVRWIVLFALLCYPIPFLPTHLIVRKKIADPQFRSSVNFGVRFLLSLLYAIVIGIVMACCHGGWMNQLAPLGAWWGAVAILMVHLGAIAAGSLVNFLRNLLDGIRYWTLRLTGRLRNEENAYRQLVQSFLALLDSPNNN